MDNATSRRPVPAVLADGSPATATPRTFLAMPPIVGYADDGQQSFLADLRKQWDAFDGAFVGWEGEAIRTQRSGTHVRSREFVDFILLQQAQRIHATDLDTGAEKAHAQSPGKGHFFSLRRSNAKELFQVSKFEPLTERHRNSDDKYALQTSFISQWIRAPLMLDGRLLPKMLSSDRFVLHGVKRTEDTSLVDVSFEYQAKPGKKSFLDAHVTLMENNFWSIKSFQSRTEQGGTDGFVEYFPAKEQSAVRLPKRVVLREWEAAPNDSKLLNNWEVEFKELKRYDIVPNDFTMASFGIVQVDFLEEAFRP